MNEVKHTHQQYADPNSARVHHEHRSYWRRAHRDWRVWVGVVLMLAAMLIYLMTDDLAWGPHVQPRQPNSSAVGK
jgi:hypothetical protein